MAGASCFWNADGHGPTIFRGRPFGAKLRKGLVAAAGAFVHGVGGHHSLPGKGKGYFISTSI